jgi:hypothetical protein
MGFMSERIDRWIEALPALRQIQEETLRKMIREKGVEFMVQNRMLTPAELKRFRIEFAGDLAAMRKRGTLVGATDQWTPSLRRAMARDETTSDREDEGPEYRRRRIQQASDVINGLSRDDTGTDVRKRREAQSQHFTGAQGRNRPAFRTPQYTTNALDQEDPITAVLNFVEDKLDPEDLERLKQMLRGEGENEANEDWPPANPNPERRVEGRGTEGFSRDERSRVRRPRAMDARQRMSREQIIAIAARAAGVSPRTIRAAMDGRSGDARISSDAEFFGRFPEAARLRFETYAAAPPSQSLHPSSRGLRPHVMAADARVRRVPTPGPVSDLTARFPDAARLRSEDARW